MDFLYGTLQDVPVGYSPPETWPEYVEISRPPNICSREEVGVDPKGIRWGLWPFTFEWYTGDREPDMSASRKGRLARTRLVVWERVHTKEKPKGWLSFSGKPSHIDGYIPLNQGEDYTFRWHKNARRDLRLFKEGLEAGRYAIVPLTLEEYAAAYRQSLIAKRVSLERLYDLERKLAYPLAREHIEMWGVRIKESGVIAAGMAVVYSPTAKGSTHFSPFILPEARDIYAATGLIDFWFARSLERSCAFAITANFWFPGKPRGWMGFSEFKSHFGFIMASYPPLLWRLAWGKIF